MDRFLILLAHNLFMEKEIDTSKIEEEQKKLSKSVILKDSFDIDEVRLIAGCEVTTLANQVICTIVVMSKDLEMIEEKFVSIRAGFPYLSAFRAYRELPAMVECWEKLENIPDVIIVNGHGILHPRKFGLASHFGLSISKPVIGIADRLICGEVKDNKVYFDGKVLGEQLTTKQGSRPIFISPGHMISLKTSVELVKKLLKEPHKLPEPLDAAHRYANRIKDELNA
jgi:deoxyribonuclease V